MISTTELQCMCLFVIVGAVAYFTTAVPDGTGSIFLDNVQCTGTESRVIDCPHNDVGTHNCAHSEDVGVRCRLRMFSITLAAACVTQQLKFDCYLFDSWLYSRRHQTGGWFHQQ